MSNRPILNNVGRVRNANFGYNSGIINQGSGSVDASTHWHNARIGQQIINVAGNQYQLVNVHSAEDLIRWLNPILDASHTRNRKRSPPDSECFPGTREEPIREIVVWADCGETVYVCTLTRGFWETKFLSTNVPSLAPNPFVQVTYTTTKTPHMYWLHGFAGCGKSSISLALAKIFAGSGRLLASYFFFRGAGDRSTMNRFAATLASQLVTAIPETAPLIQDAVRATPGLLTGEVALATQLDLLILSPFQTVRGVLEETCDQGPFLIIVDGLDECEDKQGAEEFIDHMLAFFEEHPSIPLRLFVASRVEQHIRERLEVDEVQLGNLDSHSPRGDIEKYLEASFQAAAKCDRLIRAYVSAHGEWPAKSDMRQLINHVGGSFVLASSIFKLIIQPATADDPLTPMERLPQTLTMNGLDGLYTQTLARSQHLPHFHNIISTIALLKKSFSIANIAKLLGIETFQVLHVLLNMQAIIHVPGTDNEGVVTLCHTSLRDFLTTELRSGSFFVPCSFHLHLSYYCFSSLVDKGNDQPLSPGHHNNFYSSRYYDDHWQASNYPDEIERFKAHQSLFVGRLPSHAFLCSMLWSCIMFGPRGWWEVLHSDMLVECAQHLAMAVECSDSRIRPWLGAELPVDLLRSMSKRSTTILKIGQIHKAVQRASIAIHAKYPGLLESRYHPTGEEREYRIKLSGYHPYMFRSIGIFSALEWIAARCRLMIKSGLGETTSPHPTFELTSYEIHGIIDQGIVLSLNTVIGDTPPSEVASD